QHWIEPKYLINGQDRDSFVRNVSGSSHARLDMGIAALDPKDPNILYATFNVWVFSTSDPERVEKTYYVPGLYVSYDGADTWSLFSSYVGNFRGDVDGSAELGISPSDPKIMMTQGATGVLKSTDGGTIWDPVGQNTELQTRAELEGRANEIAKLRKRGELLQFLDQEDLDLHVLEVKFQPDDPSIVFLITNKGLYRSTDGGVSWCRLEVRTRRLFGVKGLVFDPENPRRIFIGIEGGIMVSNDGGCYFRKFFDW